MEEFDVNEPVTVTVIFEDSDDDTKPPIEVLEKLVTIKNSHATNINEVQDNPKDVNLSSNTSLKTKINEDKLEDDQRIKTCTEPPSQYGRKRNSQNLSEPDISKTLVNEFMSQDHMNKKVCLINNESAFHSINSPNEKTKPEKKNLNTVDKNISSVLNSQAKFHGVQDNSHSLNLNTNASFETDKTIEEHDGYDQRVTCIEQSSTKIKIKRRSQDRNERNVSKTKVKDPRDKKHKRKGCPNNNVVANAKQHKRSTSKNINTDAKNISNTKTIKKALDMPLLNENESLLQGPSYNTSNDKRHLEKDNYYSQQLESQGSQFQSYTSNDKVHSEKDNYYSQQLESQESQFKSNTSNDKGDSEIGNHCNHQYESQESMKDNNNKEKDNNDKESCETNTIVTATTSSESRSYFEYCYQHIQINNNNNHNTKTNNDILVSPCKQDKIKTKNISKKAQRIKTPDKKTASMETLNIQQPNLQYIRSPPNQNEGCVNNTFSETAHNSSLYTAVKNMLQNVSENMIRIWEAYQLHQRVLINPNSSIYQVNNAKKSYLHMKQHYFGLSYNSSVNVILRKENDVTFVRRFVGDTLKLAYFKTYYECTELYLHTLFNELVDWVKKKNQNIRDMQDMVRQQTANPLLMSMLGNPIKSVHNATNQNARPPPPTYRSHVNDTNSNTITNPSLNPYSNNQNIQRPYRQPEKSFENPNNNLQPPQNIPLNHLHVNTNLSNNTNVQNLPQHDHNPQAAQKNANRGNLNVNAPWSSPYYNQPFRSEQFQPTPAQLPPEQPSPGQFQTEQSRPRQQQEPFSQGHPTPELSRQVQFQPENRIPVITRPGQISSEQSRTRQHGTMQPIPEQRISEQLQQKPFQTARQEHFRPVQFQQGQPMLAQFHQQQTRPQPFSQENLQTRQQMSEELGSVLHNLELLYTQQLETTQREQGRPLENEREQQYEKEVIDRQLLLERQIQQEQRKERQNKLQQQELQMRLERQMRQEQLHQQEIQFRQQQQEKQMQQVIQQETHVQQIQFRAEQVQEQITNNIQIPVEQQRSSLSRDSGIMSPPNFNGSSYDHMCNTQEDQSNITPLITHVTSLNTKANYIIEGPCYVCGKQTRKKCVGCYKFYYCTSECQYRDWGNHRAFCKTSQ